MMMSDYPGGVTLFPAKNPRPGPDPGGGRNGAGPPVVLGGGIGGGGNTSLGQVHLNDRSCQQQQHPTYPGIHPKSPATGRLVSSAHNFVVNSFCYSLIINHILRWFALLFSLFIFMCKKTKKTLSNRSRRTGGWEQ